MSTSKMSEPSEGLPVTWLVVIIMAAAAIFGLVSLVLVGLLVGDSPASLIGQVFDKLFAVSIVQAFWYVTRAAGLIAYLLLWLSTAWGVAVSTKIFDPVLHRAFTYDFHQFLSLLAIGFVTLHIVVLLADKYLPFSVAQVLVPFAAPYRPVWVGLGTIGLYLTLLVSATFYIRRWIGQKTFRAIHLVSYIAFIAAALHGLFAGTDSPLWTVQAMYIVTALSVAFLTAYRVFTSKRLSSRKSAV